MKTLLIALMLTDFSGDLPTNDANTTVSLRLVGIRSEGNVIVQLQRRQGLWGTNHFAAADYNQKSANSVQIGELQLADGQLQGTFAVQIGPDSPRPGAKGFPRPADQFAVTVAARQQRGQYAPYLPDALPFMPPWRKDEPQFGGELLTGTFTAQRGEIVTSGLVQGAISPAPVPGVWGAEGNIGFRPAEGGGVQVLARLSPSRVAPPAGARLVKLLAKPVQLGAAGLDLTVASTRRRDQAAVLLAVKFVERGWRTVTSAGLLLGREETFRVNFGEAGLIEAIALGVDNPHGVGEVEFIVRKIGLASVAASPPAVAEPVRISLGPVLDFAGTTTVPKGLFGFHDVGPPRAPTENQLQWLRQTRPGMLRPLEHTGFGGKPASDQELKARLAAKPPATLSAWAQAADAVDNLLLTHSQDLWNRPSWMDGSLSNTALAVANFYRNLAASAWTPGDEHNTLRMLELWNEPFMWGRHINMGPFNPKGQRAWTDPTQYGYIPGQLGAEAWSELFLAAHTAKAINPHLQLGGPSAPAFNDDDYGVWQNYVARIIERCGDKLDFLTEHHYGGDPRVYAASYEVAAAYCENKTGRRIPVYNTEANDLGASSAGKAAYNIADILTCLRQCPDIAKGRALHALWSGQLKDPGEQHAYRLLAPLRGKLLAVESSDPGLLLAGAVNQEGNAVVVVLNQTGRERAVVAPGEVRSARLLLADKPGAELQLRDTEGQAVPAPAAGQTKLIDLAAKDAAQVSLPPRSAVAWVLAARPDPQRVLRRDRFFSNILLQRVGPSAPVSGKVAVADAKPVRVMLRVITRDVHEGEAVALINGHQIALPYSSSNDGAAVAQDIAIDPSWLAAENQLEFRCAQPEKANGFTVYAACLLLDR